MLVDCAVGRCRWRALGRASLGALLLAACGDIDAGGTLAPAGGEGAVSGQPFRLSGAVQKGPFIVGSSIRVANLDIDTNPTGSVFSTYTNDDQGRFAVEMTASDVVSIEGDGYYYNEVTGSLSEGPITLRALYEVGAGSPDDAFVNVVTHLTYDRARGLILGALSYDDARAQAEQELQSALGITLPGFVVGAAGAQLNLLGGDTDANAYLFAVSTLLTQAAQLESPSAPDAALAELLNRLAFDLSASGSFAPARSARLALARAAIVTGMVESAFAARYPSAVVPDLDRILDQDGDGLVNAADNCAKVANALQEDRDLDGHGDACDGDTDGDGTADASDSLPNDPNEWSDADGVNDATDNCPLVANPLQEDVDLDGEGDACDGDRDGDGTPDASDSLPNDASEWSDADGVNDATDNCPLVANALQEDIDLDGAGDACDGDRDGDGTADASDSLPSDANEWSDADGVNDATDNCPLVANALQEDIDLDGDGDACDGDRDGDGTADASDSLPSDANEWTDADGANDATDNCLGLDNADQLDTDADQVGDACDPDAPLACTPQTQGQQRCSEQNLETCSLGLWSVSQACDFWCVAGACNTCRPGATFCDLAGPGTHPSVWVCDDDAILRKFVSASTTQTCLPPDMPANISSLPVDTNPPRWVRVVGSQ
jgi:thrombospondin type 3 repeat protein